MFRRRNWVSFASLVTLALISAAWFFPLTWAWGINHLRFLPDVVNYMYWAVALSTILLMFVPHELLLVDKIIKKTDRLLWRKGHLPRLFLILGCSIAFYFLRTETHFLGDGYACLSNLANEFGYIQKWTGFGAVFLVRQIQSLWGGYSEDTALLAHQITSIVSGAVVLYNLISIIGSLFTSDRLRVCALVTLVFSGATLLYCGYVEVYPLLWAAGTTYFNLALKSLRGQGRGYHYAALLAFVLTCMMHLQAVYLLAGLFWLMFHKRFQEGERLRFKPITKVLIGVPVPLLFILYVLLYQNVIEFQLIFLSPLRGRSQSPEYAMLSLKHCVDLINLVLLMFPGVIILAAMQLWRKGNKKVDAVSFYLIVSSIGSLMFLFVIDPILGLGRDWDLMAFTLFPPILAVLYRLSRDSRLISSRAVLLLTLVTVTATTLLLAANVSVAGSEKRFHSLLQFYESKDRQGWIIYANYWLRKGERQIFEETVNEMNQRFPDYVMLERGWRLLNGGEYSQALGIALRLVEKHPHHMEFVQLLGNVYEKQGRYEEAEQWYGRGLRAKTNDPPISYLLSGLYIQQQRYVEAIDVLTAARTLAPYSTDILEHLGLAYYHLRDLNSSHAIADTLLMIDPNFAGGHLLKLVISANMSNMAKARFHYREYIKYGTNRPEYGNIKESFRFLLDP